MIASASDHASSNNVMNRSLCKRQRKAYPDLDDSLLLTLEDMEIGCGGHGINRVVQ